MTVAPSRTYRYFDIVMVAFVVVLVCSNLIGPAKAATLDLPFIGAVGDYLVPERRDAPANRFVTGVIVPSLQI